MASRLARLSKIVVHVGALVPAAVIVWGLLSDNLTSNPVQAVQLHTGKTAINFLLLSLACTPVYLITGLRTVQTLARPLGLYGFAYAFLHFVNFVGIDYGFNLTLIRADALAKKRFIVAGMVALIFLLPLAITSMGFVKTRLKRFAGALPLISYLAATFAAVHYIWQAKIDVRLPVTYVVILAVLLVLRIPPLRKFLERRVNATSAS